VVNFTGRRNRRNQSTVTVPIIIAEKQAEKIFSALSLHLYVGTVIGERTACRGSVKCGVRTLDTSTTPTPRVIAVPPPGEGERFSPPGLAASGGVYPSPRHPHTQTPPHTRPLTLTGGLSWEVHRVETAPPSRRHLKLCVGPRRRVYDQGREADISLGS
jgi:hypothetical protein